MREADAQRESIILRASIDACLVTLDELSTGVLEPQVRAELLRLREKVIDSLRILDDLAVRAVTPVPIDDIAGLRSALRELRTRIWFMSAPSGRASGNGGATSG